MTNEENVIRSVFSSYINDIKVYSTNPNRPTIKMLEDVRDKAIKALETTCIEDYPTCTECEHYDSEKHYCPRFCQVIKDTLAEAQPNKDCRNCKKWNECPCGKKGHENGTSIGYSIGECKDYEPSEDCISREAVIELIGEDYGKWLPYAIMELPSVTPRTNPARTSQDCISILNRIMEYTYGMLTAEKYGLQHLIKSMMDEMSGGGEE